MQLVVGSDISEFRSYYEKTISGSDYRSAVGENDGITEMNYVAADLSHLILWKEGEQIMGHAIWHESSTDEHSKGVLRDEDDKRILRQLLGGRRDFVELHELWLGREHRGKGYGKQFFQFFENFISRRGHDALVHHAFDEAVAAICRQRGYKEKYGATAAGKTCWVFYLDLNK